MRDVNGYAMVLTFVLLTVVLLAVIVMIFRSKQQTEIRKALIEKFGSAQDLGELLQTPGGHRLLADLSTSGGSPLRSVLGSVQKGIIGLIVGLAVLIVGVLFDKKDGILAGAVLASGGVAFLVSAAVTYRLSKSWGLIANGLTPNTGLTPNKD